MDVTTIAEKLDFCVCLAFCKIPYVLWLSWALGYKVDVIETLLDDISHCRNDLAWYFRDLHQERDKIRLVGKVSLLIYFRSATPLTNLK